MRHMAGCLPVYQTENSPCILASTICPWGCLWSCRPMYNSDRCHSPVPQLTMGSLSVNTGGAGETAGVCSTCPQLNPRAPSWAGSLATAPCCASSLENRYTSFSRSTSVLTLWSSSKGLSQTKPQLQRQSKVPTVTTSNSSFF